MSTRQSKAAIALPDALAALRTGAPPDAMRAVVFTGVEEKQVGSRSSSGFRGHAGVLAASVALAAVIAAGGTVGGLWRGESAMPVYETVSEVPLAAPVVEAVPVPAMTPALDVVFRPDATVADVDTALRAVGGQIVSGPTGMGVYRVELGPSGDHVAAAQVLRAEEQGVAMFAEPALH